MMTSMNSSSNKYFLFTYRTYDNDFGGVDSVAKKSLNAMTSHRTIPIQEAVHEIDRLDLRICSDYTTDVSIGKALYLREKKNQKAYKKNDLVSYYRNRPSKYDHMSMEQFFYGVFRKHTFYEDGDTKRKKYRILVPKGLNCRPRYPVDYDYARGMLVLHKPWSVKNPLDEILNDKQRTVDMFKEMVGSRSLPIHVLSEYNRVVKYAQEYKIEALAKEGTSQDRVLLVKDMDADQLEQHVEWEQSCHISAQSTTKASNTMFHMTADIGLDYDWSQLHFKGIRADNTMEGEHYTDYLKSEYYENTSDDIIHRPTKFDGSDYELDDLSDEQRVIVVTAIDTMIKFLNNDPEYVPFRATVLGCGGTGKSHIINTLVSVVRQYTNCNDTIKVAAPSGGAAFNIQGCTLHRLLDLDVVKKNLTKKLSDERQSVLAKKLERLLMLVVDERSLLNSSLLAAAERNVRHCIFGRQNITESWGGLPVVLLFGDDYQLFPVEKCGAIEGFARRTKFKIAKSTSKDPAVQLLEKRGDDILIDDMTQHVFHLTKNYRVKDEKFRALLDNLRTGEITENEAKNLMNLSFFHYSPDKKDLIENDPKTIWLFTKNDEVRLKNTQKLVELSNRTKVPVARLKCEWSSNKKQINGVATVRKSHFKQTNIVYSTNLCVSAPVAISGINFVPELGLYNGARGIIIDIVYNNVVGPNNKHEYHLPRYIVVDFPGFKLPANIKPWDSNNPTVRVVIFLSLVLRHTRIFTSL